ncbi:prolipoprotein diacylglyceryl transferase [archaeon]|nr:prolipoprotein diacylglyceryl transferase [archaeon]|tara:strand:- start:3863 stop:4612 length:750 start_codon:yes stop_codon:yes gene_type:complete
MLIHNIDPVLFSIGGFELRYYSLAYIFGFLLAYFILLHFVKKGKIENIDRDKLDSYLIYVILGSVIGARLGYFFSKVQDPFLNILDIVKVWEGGMAFHGGLIGLVIVTLLFCKKYKIKFYELADVMVIPAALALFLGRVMNFVNGELVGIKSNVSWCVQFSNYEGCRHPSQLYESLKNLFIFFVLIIYNKKERKSGTLFWLFILLYGGLRFLITFLRDDPRIFLNLSGGQWLSLSMFLIALVVLIRRKN